MPHNPILIQKRNEQIISRFRYYKKKNPKWTIIAVIQEVGTEFYLNPSTVSKIIKGTGSGRVPSVKTVVKYSADSQMCLF